MILVVPWEFVFRSWSYADYAQPHYCCMLLQKRGKGKRSREVNVFILQFIQGLSALTSQNELIDIGLIFLPPFRFLKRFRHPNNNGRPDTRRPTRDHVLLREVFGLFCVLFLQGRMCIYHVLCNYRSVRLPAVVPGLRICCDKRSL